MGSVARRFVVAGLLGLLGCSPGARPAFPDTPTARLMVYEDTLLVRIVADGQLRTMIVDTGATITSFTRKAAARHGIVSTGKATINDATDALVAATGTIGTLELGGAVHHHVRVAIVDIPASRRIPARHDGVLGMDVLAHHDVVMDLAAGTLALHRPGVAQRHARSLPRVALRAGRGGLLLLDAVLAERHTIPAFLDLGASRSRINHAAARLLTEPVGPRKVTRNRIDIAIGSIDLLDKQLLVHDDPAFAELGLANGPAMIIGADMFYDRALVLAARDRWLYVTP